MKISLGMKTNLINEEVLYATDEVVRVEFSDIEELKQKASQNSRHRIRICVHKDVKESIHEMLIVHEKVVTSVLTCILVNQNLFIL